MKRVFILAFVSALVAGCATPPPDSNAAANSQDPNGVPIDQTTRASRPNVGVGVGLGSWGGRGFGGVGIGLGF